MSGLGPLGLQSVPGRKILILGIRHVSYCLDFNILLLIISGGLISTLYLVKDMQLVLVVVRQVVVQLRRGDLPLARVLKVRRPVIKVKPNSLLLLSPLVSHGSQTPMLSSLSLVIPLKLTLVSPFDPQLRIHPGEMAIRQIVVIWLLPEGL